jgi:hypothetical protein
MPSRPLLTIDDARSMPFEDLIQKANDIVEAYASPDKPESEEQKKARYSVGLDELPDIYRWFLHLRAYFDHWTDFYAGQEGTGKSAMEYKSMRQRRDAMEKAASYAKMRYEGTSRCVTILLGETDHMPRGRG